MKTGKMASSPLFVLRYMPSKLAQYAFVAPKTVAKQAVLRNSLRRRGYNALAQIVKKPYIIGIFFYKKGAPKASFKEIKEDIDILLKKNNL